MFKQTPPAVTGVTHTDFRPVPGSGHRPRILRPTFAAVMAFIALATVLRLTGNVGTTAVPVVAVEPRVNAVDAASDSDEGDSDEGDLDEGESGVEGDSDGEGDTDGAPEAEEEPPATFSVRGDRLTTIDATASERRHALAIWNRFVAITPARSRALLTEFQFNPTEKGGAFVARISETPEAWVLNVAAGNDTEDLDELLVHELGHLVTLHRGEVLPATAGPCRTVTVYEGCAAPKRLLAEFARRFWSAGEIAEANQIAENVQDGSEEDAGRIYRRNPGAFVSDYAATSPVEDLAETFAVFVLESPPTGTTMADRKVQMLAAYPDMVALRAEILGLLDAAA